VTVLDPELIPATLRRPTAPLCARIERAALNATQPAQQQDYDGWLLRFSPGRAKRARSINPVAAGELSLARKLSYCADFYRHNNLPCLYRITPFSQPDELDGALVAAGFRAQQDTRVMWTSIDAAPIRSGGHDGELSRLDPRSFGALYSRLHGLPAAQAAAEADRYACAPGTTQFVALAAAGGAIACGSVVVEAELAGIFGMITAPGARRRGAASRIVAALLARAQAAGATTAYLQVEADNAPARRVYSKFGFTDAYAYWYRERDNVGEQS
jgi:GNAT superfamily N-acetyltransferase